ncbi:MAG TPA: hypothetical protein PKC76_15670 [Saprospiraceae bacterium]|nr:hypothetical protein [Saprospiraceae bacterium]HMP25573.1 hypothetical protein [Saprospiraceae bacterium]
MKALFTISLILLLPVLSFCQLEKGTWMLSFTAATDAPAIAKYNDANIGTITYLQLSTRTTVGYFLSKHWVAGANIGGTILYNSSSDNVSSGIGLSPLVRYYLNPNHERRNWFLTAAGGITAGVDSDGADIAFGNLALGGGVNYFLAPGVALEGFVGTYGLNQEDAKLITSLGLQFFLHPNRDKTTVSPAIGTGTLLLGGSGNIALYDNAWGGNLSPNVGIFVNDRLALGTGLVLIYRKTTGSDLSVSLGLLTPFVRYYFNPEQGRTLWFAAVSAGLARVTLNNSNFPDRNNSFVRGASVGLGLNYFITPHAAIEAQLNFGYSAQEALNLTRVGGSLGLQFFLPSQKR